VILNYKLLKAKYAAYLKERERLRQDFCASTPKNKSKKINPRYAIYYS